MMVADSRNTEIGQASAKKCRELPCVAPQLRERGSNTQHLTESISKRIYFKPICEKMLPSTQIN